MSKKNEKMKQTPCKFCRSRYIWMFTLVCMVERVRCACLITDSNVNGYVNDWVGGNASPGGCGHISGWDVSRVTSLRSTFCGFNGYCPPGYWNWCADCRGSKANFNEDISSWNVARVENLFKVFHKNTAFNRDISSWNVAQVTSISSAFEDASSFNQDLSTWNVERVEYIDEWVFHGATSMNSCNKFNIRRSWSLIQGREVLPSWPYERPQSCTCTLSDVNLQGSVNNVFQSSTQCRDISLWDVSRITSLDYVFSNNPTHNVDISLWNVGKVTSMKYTFFSATAFNADISSWDVGKVTSMDYSFFAAAAFNVDISLWNVQNVRGLISTFSGATAFNQNIASWNTFKVASLQNIFSSASSFNQDISSWSTALVTDMYGTFSFATLFNQDITEWNVMGVTNMYNMFVGATAFTGCNKLRTAILWDDVGAAFRSEYADWTNEGCSKFPEYLSRIQSIECGFGTSSCMCAGLDFSRAIRHCVGDCGSIPAALGNCDELVELNLTTSDENKFLVGSMPTELGQLTNLTVLDLGRTNALNGTIPPHFGNLSQLFALNLGGTNTFGGPIPTELGKLSQLRKLDLGGSNTLTGPIPLELGILSRLESLYIDGGSNRCNGSIPSQLGELVNLVSLNLFGNLLSGEIPSSFGRLSNLQRLILSQNTLISPIPLGIFELSKLVELRIDRNSFSGPIPDFCNMSALEILHLDRNGFTGSISPDHFICNSALARIDLGFNRFNGEVPRFSGLARVSEIMLSNNLFSRVRPDTFAGTLGMGMVIDLAHQHSGSGALVLNEGAFRDIGTSADIVLTGNRIDVIPTDCFHGLSNSRLDLSNIRINALNATSFSGLFNVDIDLSSNYIESVEPSAFFSFGEALNSTGTSICTNAYGWSRAQCEKIYRFANNDTCGDADTCKDKARFSFDSETGLTPLAACCDFGGGFQSGTNLVMDVASPVTCSLLSTNRSLVTCHCSNPNSRFDIEKSICRTGCEPGYMWISSIPEEVPESIEYSPESPAGRCGKCDAGRKGLAQSWDDPCIDCIPGRYANFQAATVCHQCNPGSFTNTSHATICRKCVNGTRSAASRTECVNCLAGTYSITPNGATICIDCMSGRYSPSNRSSACTDCASGSFTGVRAGSTQCVTCDPGTYSRLDLSTECNSCNPGTFANTSGATACRTCPNGTRSTPSRTTCVECFAGSYSYSKNGATICSTCPGGTYTATNRSSTCLSCPNGTRSTPSRTTCVECFAGSYSNSKNGATICSTCPGGTYTATNRSSTCLSCPAGRRSASRTKSSACIACGYGMYSREPEQSSCLECRRGEFSNIRNATACQICPPGTMSNASARSSKCIPLPPGQYSAEGARCGRNTYSTGGTTVCEECPRGRQSGEAASECTECDFFYKYSAHCKFPITGFGLFTVVALIVLIVGYALRRRFRKRIVETTNKLKRSESRLVLTERDKTQMESAWQIDWNSIQLVKRLASGGCGEVWKGVMGDTYDVAIKKMFKTETVDLNKEKEVHFLKRARHTKLVWFMGCGYIDNVDTKNIFVVLEFMNRGDLCGLLWEEKRKGKGTPPPSWGTRISLLKDTAEGMSYIHVMLDKLHRDLKSPNILLASTKSGRLIAKVADFGLAKGLHTLSKNVSASDSTTSSPPKKRKSATSDSAGRSKDNDGHESTKTETSKTNTDEIMMTSFLGSLLWMAPEVYMKCGEKKRHYDKKVDVYSFGIILWESLALYQPWTHDGKRFKNATRPKIMNAVEKGERPPISEAQAAGAPSGYVELVRACWDGNPNVRPHFQDILPTLQDMEPEIAERAGVEGGAAASFAHVLVNVAESKRSSSRSGEVLTEASQRCESLSKSGAVPEVELSVMSSCSANSTQSSSNMIAIDRSALKESSRGHPSITDTNVHKLLALVRDDKSSEKSRTSATTSTLSKTKTREKKRTSRGMRRSSIKMIRKASADARSMWSKAAE